jgi:peptidoglycan hydrolase CwlO-like protein
MLMILSVWCFGLTVGSCGPNYNWKIMNLDSKISSQNYKITNLESNLSWAEYRLKQTQNKLDDLEIKCNAR